MIVLVCLSVLSLFVGLDDQIDVISKADGDDGCKDYFDVAAVVLHLLNQDVLWDRVSEEGSEPCQNRII